VIGTEISVVHLLCKLSNSFHLNHRFSWREHVLIIDRKQADMRSGIRLNLPPVFMDLA
jgi:hypothetical protein